MLPVLMEQIQQTFQPQLNVETDVRPDQRIPHRGGSGGAVGGDQECGSLLFLLALVLLLALVPPPQAKVNRGVKVVVMERVTE